MCFSAGTLHDSLNRGGGSRTETPVFREDLRMFEWCSEYLYFYKKSLIHAWQTLGPTEYAVVLMLVATVGFITMRKGPQAKC